MNPIVVGMPGNERLARELVAHLRVEWTGWNSPSVEPDRTGARDRAMRPRCSTVPRTCLLILP